MQKGDKRTFCAASLFSSHLYRPRQNYDLIVCGDLYVVRSGQASKTLSLREQVFHYKKLPLSG